MYLPATIPRGVLINFVLIVFFCIIIELIYITCVHIRTHLHGKKGLCLANNLLEQ